MHRAIWLWWVSLSPMTGVRTVREQILFQDKRKEQETELSTHPLPGPSWVMAALQSTHKWSALQVYHIWTFPPYLEGEIPEELTPSAQTPHSKQWSRCWSVCRSVKIQARWLVPHCWMPSSLQGPTGYISPQESLPVTNDVTTSNDILPGMSPSQNKLKILNQV